MSTLRWGTLVVMITIIAAWLRFGNNCGHGKETMLTVLEIGNKQQSLEFKCNYPSSLCQHHMTSSFAPVEVTEAAKWVGHTNVNTRRFRAKRQLLVFCLKS